MRNAESSSKHNRYSHIHLSTPQGTAALMSKSQCFERSLKKLLVPQPQDAQPLISHLDNKLKGREWGQLSNSPQE